MSESDTKLDSILEKLSMLKSLHDSSEKRLERLEKAINPDTEESGNYQNSRNTGLTFEGQDDHTYSRHVPSDNIDNQPQRLAASYRTRAIRNLGQNTSQGVTAAGTVSQSASSDIQEEFRAIKDALQRIKLPSDVKVDDSKQGIKRQELSKAHIISKCAQYCETLFKLLLTIEPDQVLSQGDLNDLSTIVQANIRYLQEERGLVLVNSSLGTGVGGIYRNFRRNTTVFPPEALDALTAAVTLHSASANNTSQYQSNSGYRGGYRGYRGGYRSGYRGGSHFNNSGGGRGHQFPNRIQGNNSEHNDNQ